MIIKKNIADVRETIRQWRRQGDYIALVPTMGYFHAGHCALMRSAHEMPARVAVSLFVNPTQFGPNEDLAVYPRDFEGDCQKAREAGVDLLFCPEVAEMYGGGEQTVVTVGRLSEGLCGAGRPGHFQGVTTVVAKLLNIFAPDVAVFGEKDFQQLTIIKRMVADLRSSVQIVGHQTVREADGLALSSRNIYLSAEDRQAALVLFHALRAIQSKVASVSGVLRATDLIAIGKRMIAAEPRCECEYFSIVDEQTLQVREDVAAGIGCRALGAIRVGHRVRLIDNMPL